MAWLGALLGATTGQSDAAIGVEYATCVMELASEKKLMGQKLKVSERHGNQYLPSITAATLDEVLDDFIQGTDLRKALGCREIKIRSFYRCITAPWAATLWSEAQKAFALFAMIDVYQRAKAVANAAPSNPIAIATLGKVTHSLAKAFDNAVWGDKVQVDAKQLVIVTNLNFEAGEESLAEAIEGAAVEMEQNETETNER